MKIIVDTLGADKGPAEVIEGSIDALKEYGIDLIFVGDQEEIESQLSKYTYNKNKVEIVEGPVLIENSESPALAIRRKKEASMVVGFNLLRDGRADGLVSCGSTGALLAGGLLIVKRIKGIERAALASVFPTTKGRSFLLDMGANTDCKPEYLYQFALMGSVYSEKVLGMSNPRVGLINIGEEEGKGDSLRKDSFELLKESKLNFIGNYEARNILNGDCEVMVTDGFTGNIILKSVEGLAQSLSAYLKSEIMTGTKAKLGGLLLKDKLRGLKDNFDYREYGGAVLLGVKKPVVKAHGSSDAYAIKNAIRQLMAVIDKDIVGIIEENIRDKEVE